MEYEVAAVFRAIGPELAGKLRQTGDFFSSLSVLPWFIFTSENRLGSVLPSGLAIANLSANSTSHAASLPISFDHFRVARDTEPPASYFECTLRGRSTAVMAGYRTTPRVANRAAGAGNCRLCQQ